MIAGAVGLVTGLFKSAPAAALEAAGADETASQSKAIDTFAVHLTVAPIRNSRLVDVKFRSADAALATGIVNALAQNYIDQTLEYKFSANKDANDWLGGQLAEQRKQVEAAEAKLQAYREHNDAISLEDRQNIVVQKLTDLNSAVTRAKTERIQKEAMWMQLRALENNPAALDTFPAILSNTFIQQQKSELAQLQQQSAPAVGEVRREAPGDRQEPDGDSGCAAEAAGRDRQGRRGGAHRISRRRGRRRPACRSRSASRRAKRCR